MDKKAKDWGGHEPPREKLLAQGAIALSDRELLAIFLRTGVKGISVMYFAEQLLSEFGSLYALMAADFQQFSQHKGLGLAKYAQLQGAIELSRRFFSHQLMNTSALSNPMAVFQYVAAQLSHQERELFMVLFLNNRNQLLLSEILFTGTYNCVEVHPREIIRLALKYNASALILAHNHPSGSTQPSHADCLVTDKIRQASEVFDIKVLDHIIIGEGAYFSFAEQGMI